MRKQGEMTYDLSPLPNDLHRCEGALVLIHTEELD